MEARYPVEGDVLNIEAGTKPGCVTVIALSVVILGGLAFALPSAYILFTSAEFSPFALLFLVAGLIAILAIVRALGQSTGYAISIDRAGEVVRFRKPYDEEDYCLSFGDLSHFLLKRGVHQGTVSGPHRGTVSERHHIYLVKVDGALFWIDTLSNRRSRGVMHREVRQRAEQRLVSVLEELTQFIDLPVVDERGLEGKLDREGMATYEKKPVRQSHSPSPFVYEKEEEQGVVITLLEPRNRTKLVFHGLLLFFVLGILGGLLRYALLFGSPFREVSVFIVLLLVLLILFSILPRLRRYGILLNRARQGEELTVRLTYTWSWLDRRCGRTVAVPRAAIRQVRVSRLEQGVFWLYLIMDHPVEGLSAPFGFKYGVFLESLPHYVREENALGLWQVWDWERRGQGPDYQDLHYVEERIQTLLELDEQSA